MRVVEVDLSAQEINAESLKTLVGDGKAYTAECSTSPDGRTLLYTTLESGDGDLYAMDLPTKKITRLTAFAGYDGGGFFSPDGKKIVWRADRNADNLLQIFVADVVFDSTGAVVGIGEPIAVTNDAAVNWAPYFSPNGKVIVYASSRVGHDNYELLAVPVPADHTAPLGQPRRPPCLGLRTSRSCSLPPRGAHCRAARIVGQSARRHGARAVSWCTSATWNVSARIIQYTSLSASTPRAIGRGGAS
jgi:hypothetical protein